MEPYENLANAIVMQAVKDYREAIHFLKRHPHTPDLDTEEAMKDKRKRILREQIINNEGLLGLSCFQIWMGRSY